LYFLFIILSVLHLDFKLSFFTGLLAAVEFAAIVYFGFHAAETEALDKMLPENSFYLRSIIILISGQAAAFVAEELKKRIQHTFALQQSKNEIEILFGQQVSREVLQTLTIEKGKTKKLEATVLALDIRNFSAFAENKSPDQIMDFQNQIFSPIIKIINQHQGVVNQILGDGIMATFGTPVANPLHPDMAFESALQIRKKVFELFKKGIIPETRIGIGIHTGDVITGNIGNEIRKQYSISGSAVIIAFRVEQLNKEFHTEILITDAVKNRITPGSVSLTSLGKQTMKGFGYEVELYKVE
jgi:adenylate cyclase